MKIQCKCLIVAPYPTMLLALGPRGLSSLEHAVKSIIKLYRPAYEQLLKALHMG